MYKRLLAFLALLALLVPTAAAAAPVKASPMSLTFQQGTQTATPVDDPILLVAETNLLLQNFFFYETPIMDVRAFQSYGLRVRFTGGTWLASDIISVTVRFFADSAGVTELFREDYLTFQNQAVRLTDQMHGAYVRLAFEDALSVNRTTTMTLAFYGSYRPMSNAYLRTSDDSILYDVARVGLAAGTNDGGAAALLAYGPALLTVTTDQVPVTVDIRLGGTGVNSTRYQLTLTVANARATQMIVLPRVAAWIVINNNAALAATIRATLYQQVQPL